MKKNLITLLVIITLVACNSDVKEKFQVDSKKEEKNETNSSNKISVLNFGTIHLSGSTDAISNIININNPQVKLDIKKVVDELVKFKPTVICIEVPSESNDFIKELIPKYKEDQSNRMNYSEEVNVIGLEIGRLSGAKRIYGIDFHLEFDYPKLMALANKKAVDSLYIKSVFDNYERVNAMPLLEQFIEINKEESKMETFNLYNLLATQHSESNFEGSDEIAQFYKRNLIMFTNFSEIPVTKNDRVLIILGATHTAYFDIFLKNSHKYKLENISDYINYGY